MTAPEIQQEIDRTRERLGETVDELAAKADVKARTQAKAAEMKARAQGKATEMKAKATEVSGQVRRSPVVQRRWPVAAAAASIVLVGSLLAWRRRKT